MSTKRKFIESHWLTFAIKGVISLIAGLCMMLTGKTELSYLTQIVGWTMVCLAIIELLNCLRRARRAQNLGFPLFLGFVELAIAIFLLVAVIPGMATENLTWIRIELLAAYVLFASIVTMLMGFKSFSNMTDRFMWVVNGMIGCVLAFVISADVGLSELTHIKVFGTYLMVNGLTDLFFGIHSRDEMAELHAERAKKREERKKIRAEKHSSKKAARK